MNFIELFVHECKEFLNFDSLTEEKVHAEVMAYFETERSSKFFESPEDQVAYIEKYKENFDLWKENASPLVEGDVLTVILKISLLLRIYKKNSSESPEKKILLMQDGGEQVLTEAESQTHFERCISLIYLQDENVVSRFEKTHSFDTALNSEFLGKSNVFSKTPHEYKPIPYKYCFIVDEKLRAIFNIEKLGKGQFEYAFYETLMQTLKAQGLLLYKPVVKFDFNRSCKIAFTYFPSENYRIFLGKLIEFLVFLKQLGLCEFHENKHALWFYTNSGGSEILNHQNYPERLVKFLRDEKESFKKIIESGEYDGIIEIGCGNLENIDLAVGRKYLGIDFSSHRVVSANALIAKEGIKNARVELLNVLNIDPGDLNEFMKEVKRPLMIFPFNVIGNVAPISLLLLRLRLLEIDLAVSIYKTTDIVNEIRKEYYETCGYTDVIYKQDFLGTYFVSENGLYTVAYHDDYVISLLNYFGFDTEKLKNELGFVIHANSDKFAPKLDMDVINEFSQRALKIAQFQVADKVQFEERKDKNYGDSLALFHQDHKSPSYSIFSKIALPEITYINMLNSLLIYFLKDHESTNNSKLDSIIKFGPIIFGILFNGAVLYAQAKNKPDRQSLHP